MIKLQNQIDFFTCSLQDSDPEIYNAIKSEFGRQQEEIELIASENIVSRAILEAQGSIMTNKYAEGYSGKRYYGGCQFVDIAENLAIERAKKLFNCNFANVQPHSGSQMNQAAFLALMKPGDTFMGLDLDSGGHLTHGASVNLSGKWFNVISYDVSKKDHLIDMDNVAEKAQKHKPKLIIAGGTAYSRFWDFKRFREIADAIGAWLMVDMSHISGLVAGGAHPSPFPHAHLVTTTTHKSLRGPRGGMILCNDAIISQKINSAVFPGMQGGPFMHAIAAKAVAFGEALKPEFKSYTQNIVKNAKTLATTLQKNGFNIVSGGTDNHLMVVDLRNKNLNGKNSAASLGRANIVSNRNSIPFDQESPAVTSGIRFGTPAGTTRGFQTEEFIEIGNMITEVLEGLRKSDSATDNKITEDQVRDRVKQITNRFPLYPNM